MAFTDEYGHFILLGAGLVMLSFASKRKPRKTENRTGEICDPKESAPFGYECVQKLGGHELREQRGLFIGFGPYINREAINDTLAELGFSSGDLASFQIYMSRISDWDLRRDGIVDRDSMIALKEAETMMNRDEWPFPGMGV